VEIYVAFEGLSCYLSELYTMHCTNVSTVISAKRQNWYRNR